MTKQELIDMNEVVERIRKGAYKEGFDAGYAEGYRDGEDGPPERRLGSIFA